MSRAVRQRTAASSALRIRRLASADRLAVARVDAHHTGARKAAYWKRIFREFVETRAADRRRVGLAAERGGRLAGYLLGEVRAFEFGSEPCGWIFAVGVDPRALRGGVASALLAQALHEFHEAGIGRVRTMVKRNDIPVLSFFRSSGFTGGSYVQLERETSPAA
jgi:ribosomal protein S18 acetylase RimI-like enzyme